MYAIVDILGFQEKVTAGDTLEVPLHDGDAGKALVFDKVLMVVNGDAIQLGKPYVSGAKVEAEVVDHGRDDKVRVVKFRRRKRYLRVKGHQQRYTTIKITKVTA